MMMMMMMMMMNSTNKTSDEKRLELNLDLLCAILYAINIPLTVLGNLLICWVVYKYQRLRTPDNILLVSLSCANLVTVFVFISRLVVYFSPELKTGVFCVSLMVVCKKVLMLTTIHLCIISIDRMLAIKYPLRYPLWVTNRRALLLAGLLWIVILALAIVELVHRVESDFWQYMARCYGPVKHASKRKAHIKKGQVINLVLSYIIPLLIVLTSYGIIFKVVKGQTSKAYPETQKQAKRKSELKAAKTIGLLIGAFLIFYTPLYMFSFIRTMKGQKSDTNRVARLVLRYLGHLSSCASWINPIIYALTNKEVKEHCKKLFSRICRKNN